MKRTLKTIVRPAFLFCMTAACAALLFGPAAMAQAATTYYVDYEGGDDAAAGTSPEQAFRHAPGDPQAGAAAAGVELQPGDIVMFKGGVIYRGQFRVRSSGTSEAPITYDGNSDGTFGEGRAILDGGEPITGWERCSSPEECGGNPHYASIYRVRLPQRPGLDAQSAGIVQDEHMLYPAQYPNPEDPFYDCDTSRYLDAPRRPSRTQLSDERLAEFGAKHLVGAWVYMRVTSNFVDYQPITAWDGETHTITYERANRDPVGPYSIANSLHEKVMDGPGQYVLREAEDGEHILYVWPMEERDPSESVMSYNVRGTAIELDRGTSHVRIQGFRIRHYARSISGRETEGITIHDNEITRIRHRAARGGHNVMFVTVRDLTISDNFVHDCQRTNAFTSRIGENVVYRGNRVHRVGRSAFRFYDIQHGQIVDNVIIDSRGIHSNVLTIYLDCRDILVARNRIHQAARALTLQRARRIYIINNIFTDTVGLWPGNPTEQYYFLNNYIGGAEDIIFVNERNARDFVIKNNVIQGIGGYPLGDSHALSHNLYIGEQFTLHEGEFFVENASQVVRDPEAYDFRPLTAGPTIDMGTDVSEYYPRETFPDFDFDTDFDGGPRVWGEAIDIGPYERRYEEGELAGRDSIATGADAEPPAPIDAYVRVDDAEPIVIRARDFMDEGGGEVGLIDEERQAHKNFVRGWNVEGHWLSYSVDAEAEGEYAMSLRYAADFNAPRRIRADGEVVEEVTLPDTGGWAAFTVFEVESPVRLSDGVNEIRLTSLGGRGCNLDEIRFRAIDGEEEIVVSGGDFSEEGSSAEEAVEIVPAPHHGLFYRWNAEGHWLEWTIEDAAAGKYEVVLRYATLMNSPRELLINGETVEHLDYFVLDRTPGWRETNEASLRAPVELQEGRNVLRLNSLGGRGLNLDEIRLVPVRERRESGRKGYDRFAVSPCYVCDLSSPVEIQEL